jgi:hypothetical protein
MHAGFLALRDAGTVKFFCFGIGHQHKLRAQDAEQPGRARSSLFCESDSCSVSIILECSTPGVPLLPQRPPP